MDEATTIEEDLKKTKKIISELEVKYQEERKHIEKNLCVTCKRNTKFRSTSEELENKVTLQSSVKINQELTDSLRKRFQDCEFIYAWALTYQEEKKDLTKALCKSCKKLVKQKFASEGRGTELTNELFQKENRDLVSRLKSRFQECEKLQSESNGASSSVLNPNVTRIRRTLEVNEQGIIAVGGGDRWKPEWNLNIKRRELHALPPYEQVTSTQRIEDLNRKILKLTDENEKIVNMNYNLEKKIDDEREDLNKEIQNLKDENKTILSENQNFKSQLNEERRHLTMLQIELQKARAEQRRSDEKHGRELVDYERRNHELEKGIKSTRTECNELEKQLRDRNETVERATKFLHDENVSLHRKIHQLTSNIEQTSTEKDDLVTQLVDYKTERKKLLSELEITLAESSERKSVIEELKENLREQKQQEDTLQREKENLSIEIRKKALCIERLNEELEKTAKEVSEQKSAILTLEEKNKILCNNEGHFQKEVETLELRVGIKESENEQLQKEISAKIEEIKNLKKQMEKPIPPLVMGIRSIGSGLSQNDFTMITREFSRLLKNKFKRDNINLIIKPCSSLEEVSNGPMIVLCLSRSRIGANVKDAMEGMKASKDVVIMILHHVKESTVSSIYPTKHQIGTDYPDVSGILDIAYQEDQGIYDCDFNAETLQILISLLTRYASKQ